MVPVRFIDSEFRFIRTCQLNAVLAFNASRLASWPVSAAQFLLQPGRSFPSCGTMPNEFTSQIDMPSKKLRVIHSVTRVHRSKPTACATHHTPTDYRQLANESAENGDLSTAPLALEGFPVSDQSLILQRHSARPVIGVHTTYDPKQDAVVNPRETKRLVHEATIEVSVFI